MSESITVPLHVAAGDQRRRPPVDRADRAAELVVLLDPFGRPSGAMPKRFVHNENTPLHLAFSCYVVDGEGRVLVTRRAASKSTWPATWTNACCGHPLPGESLRRAVARRLDDELGLSPRRLGVAVPDFLYRATMDDGVTEHELCPVVVAEVEGVPAPDPDEVDDLEWVAWDALVERARLRPETLSPWSVEQIGHLAALAPSPLAWLDDNVGPDAGALGEVGLDRAPDEPPPSDWDPIATVRGPVDDVLRTFLAEQESALAGMGRTISEMSDEVHNLMDAGGKRLRPAFVYWGHRATGAGHDDGVYRAAAAVELLHTFALIHDDVMDRSRTRRGRPTAQRSLAELHGREGLQGDGAWFGLSGALLAGDLAFVWADQLLETAPLPAEAVAAARRVFTHLRTEVISGQYLDVRLSHAPVGEQAEREALQVALLKSARYTVTRPLELGVALAGRRLGGERLRAALARYGDAVGLAFQMRDDILGLYGDSELMGKSCLDDLREGKRTLLVLRALRLTSGDDKRFLEGSLGDPDLDATAALRCCRIVATSGALASVEALVEAQRARALRAIAGIDGPAQAALEQLAASATRRDR